MHLLRCQDQKPQSLEEFFSELSQHLALQKQAEAMTGILARLRTLPGDHTIYGLTSHARLCLLAEDTYLSPWFVIVSAWNERNYFVEYLMPDQTAPWPGAYVRGEARSEDEAIRMIVTAIEKSEGWSSNSPRARLKTALREPRPSQAVLQLARALRDEGMEQQALYRLFDQFRAQLQDTDEQCYDAILDAMDMITGFCSPDRRLYDTELS